MTDKSIRIMIQTPKAASGSYGVVAYFDKYKGDDDFSMVTVNGISDSYEMYDASFDYELNHKDYWESLSDSMEVNYSLVFNGS